MSLLLFSAVYKVQNDEKRRASGFNNNSGVINFFKSFSVVQRCHMCLVTSGHKFHYWTNIVIILETKNPRELAVLIGAIASFNRAARSSGGRCVWSRGSNTVRPQVRILGTVIIVIVTTPLTASEAVIDDRMRTYLCMVQLYRRAF